MFFVGVVVVDCIFNLLCQTEKVSKLKIRLNFVLMLSFLVENSTFPMNDEIIQFNGVKRFCTFIFLFHKTLLSHQIL